MLDACRAAYAPANVSTALWPLYFLTGLAAGFVDSLAGGGGLITLPVLLGTGLAPAEALATNKLQAVFGSGSAVWHYRRARCLRLADVWPGVLATASGAVLGVLAVSLLDTGILRRVIPFLLVAVAVLIWRRPNLGAVASQARFRLVPFQVCAGLALGFYDGFFGPGTGSLWTMALVLGVGFELLRATAWTKAMNFTSNAVALAAFLLATRVDWTAGLLMGSGQALGARWGARVALRGGARVIRPVFLTVSVLVATKLLFDALAQG